MALQVGFEPTTNRLTADRSTTEPRAYGAGMDTADSAVSSPIHRLTDRSIAPLSHNAAVAASLLLALNLLPDGVFQPHADSLSRDYGCNLGLVICSTVHTDAKVRSLPCAWPACRWAHHST